MGGNLPLGYDVHNRQLVINEAEAETVLVSEREWSILKTCRGQPVAARLCRESHTLQGQG